MKKSDLLCIVFWIGLSTFFMVASYMLGLGEFRNPGPGLFPFLLGACVFLVACYFLISSLIKSSVPSECEHKSHSWRHYLKIGSVLAALLGYALALERIGYLITSALFLAFCFGVMDHKRWRLLVIASILTTLISYFGFVALGVRFPAGIIRLR